MNKDNNVNKDKNISTDSIEVENRKQLIKSYIDRLSQGEDLEVVRKEFVENFKSVDASEIAQAEQELIQGGVPVKDVQRLCDVHSALFHGMTSQEQESTEDGPLPGHPLQIFLDENDILLDRINSAKKLDPKDDLAKLLEELSVLRLNIRDHYSRKADLVYPLLSRTYNFSGPSDVMWGVDGEIRNDLGALVGLGGKHSDFEGVLDRALTRGEEMIYKENNILFPLCIDLFSEEDWMRIYYELSNYDDFLEVTHVWEQAEEKREELRVIGGKLARDRKEEVDMNQEIVLGSGHMTVEQILGVLNTIPMELTFIDDKDINKFFSKHTPLFKRPDMAIGRDVHSCHPPKASQLAGMIIDEFRAGTKDKYEFFRYINDEPVYIRYIAVRNEKGKFLGTLEAVEELGYAEKHFTTRKRRNTNL